MNPRWREIAINCWDERTDGLHFDQEIVCRVDCQRMYIVRGFAMVTKHI
jgi:hypothetical protein